MAARRLIARPAESEAPGMEINSPHLQAKEKQASLGCLNVVCSVDWNGRRADSCGISGTGETPQALWRREGSLPAPRKAKRLGWKSTVLICKQNKKYGWLFIQPLDWS
ncbi:hypothetical protein [Bacillus badius]|uniref:hypothetical protein n=1 Tax=Bacillus badius TaxID=1455 RepID=UPI000596DB33|nr:hypothetical protein [Bacillus badius]